MLKNWILINNSSILCKYCNLLLNSKYSTLKDHAKSKKHIKNAAPFSNSRSRQQLINNPRLKLSNEVHSAEARTALNIAKHSTMRSVDHLTKLNKANFTDSAISSNCKLSNTKCGSIIVNGWFPYLKNELSKDIGDGPFSLINIDESTDLSVTKYLAVVIKYYSKKNNIFHTRLLKLESLDLCNASSIVTVILKILSEFN